MIKIFVYSPDTASIDPFQIALRREGLDVGEAREHVETMTFKDRQRVGSGWKSPPMIVRWDGVEEGRPIEACDFPIPYDSGAIVMGERAHDVLADFVMPYGELLRLDSDGGRFWVLNVTCVLDALDPALSEWLPVPDERPMLWREGFRKEMIMDAVLFRLPASAKKSGTYFTQRFLDEVGRYRLTGLHGREIWNSETGVVI